MPRYDYQCQECRQVFEIKHNIGGKLSWSHCPYCDKHRSVTKFISQTSFRLGWRKTPHPGKRTPVKRIGNQLYDEDSYKVAKVRGRKI